jgi:Flp pilus assembly protein TadG
VIFLWLVVILMIVLPFVAMAVEHLIYANNVLNNILDDNSPKG